MFDFNTANNNEEFILNDMVNEFEYPSLGDYFDNLNESQKDAVFSTQGYVRVIAGAGTGKTKVLTSRYIHLVHDLDIPFENILCVTFTNKAANEMKTRIKHYFKDIDLSMICTFHGFCVKFLRIEHKYADIPKWFNILDEEDSKTIIKNICSDLSLDESREFKVTDIKKLIELFKKDNKYIENLLYMSTYDLLKKSDEYEDIQKKIFYRYLYEQSKTSSLDFNDLIKVTLYILDKYPKTADKWSKKLQYILVDEFQDVSISQFRLMDILSSHHKNLFVVGDPDQTIYSFRGANVKFILDFDKTHENTKTITLKKNYRSTQSILNVSNSLIKHNILRDDKELFSYNNNSGELVTYNHFKSDIEQKNWIAKTISSLVENKKLRYHDFAILYRAHFCARQIEESLLQHNIPYTVYSGISFYERKEIKDILSYLKLIVYQDDLSLRRIINVPKRNFGKKKMSIILDYAEANQVSLYDALKEKYKNNDFIQKSDVNQVIELVEKYKNNYKNIRITDLLADILTSSGYEKMLLKEGDDDRLDNLEELKLSINNYESNYGEEVSVEEYLQDITLLTNLDQEEKKDTVSLMSIHRAKGLEFPYVFVVDLNEGIFPSRNIKYSWEMEEERRLAYVAMTRAEKRLFLTDAEGITIQNIFRYPSRFIFNIKKELMEYSVELDESLISKTDMEINRVNEMILKNSEVKKKIAMFNCGDYIKHKFLGKGKILKINSQNNTAEIQFENSQYPTSIRLVPDKIKVISK